MNIRVHLIWFLASLLCSGSLVAQERAIVSPFNPSSQIIETIGKKAFWGQIDWKNPETSNLFSASEWKEYSGDSIPPVRILKRANLETDGFNATINLSKSIDSSSRAFYQIQIYGGNSSCASLLDWAESVFSAPNRKLDTSYRTFSGAMVIDKKFQWDIESRSRVKLTCAGLTPESGKNNSDFGILEFTSTQNQEQIKPLIYLNCKIREKEKVGFSNKASEEMNMQFVISEDSKRIMNQKFEPTAGDVVITDRLIEFNFWGAKGRTIETQINRLNGDYRGVIHNGKNEAIFKLNLAGKCERTSPTGQKF